MEAYFDNAATTKVFPEVKDLVVKLMEEDYGNPSSLHQKGLDAGHYIKETKEILAKEWKVDSKEIVLTSGGTESNNLALIGAALANKRSGNRIITSKVEHASVSSTMAFLESLGFEVVYLNVDHQGIVDLEQLEQEVNEDTILVSVMYVNNEIGAVEPIQEIAEIIKEKNPKTLFHVDAIQAFGKYHIYPKRMGIDLMSVSGHKIHGPKGTGALFIKNRTKVKPIIYGGGQQDGMRSGTENVPGIVGIGTATKRAIATMEERTAKEREMRDYLIKRVMEEIPYTKLNGHPTDRLPNNANFCFRFIEGESMLIRLDMAGICGSSGSACTSGSLDPSHVLLAIGLPHEIAHGSLRLTLNEEITKEDIDYVVDQLKTIVSELRGMSPLYEEFAKKQKK